MPRIKVFFTLTAACILFACAATRVEPEKAEQSDSRKNAAAELRALLDDHWAAAQSEKIFFRTDPDAFRMDGPLTEHTAEARSRRQAFNESILARLDRINPNHLDANDLLTWRLFRYERETERLSHQQPDHYFPINSLFGYHTYFAESPANTAFLSAQAYENYLVSLADFTRYNREHIALLREAVAKGFTHYCQSMQGYAGTIQAHIVDDPRQSGLYEPFTRFPGNVNGARQADLTRRGVELIRAVVVPGYRELLAFYQGEYEPACRRQVGVNSLPGGEAYYQYLIGYYTTTDLTPEQIHALGQSELERILAEMQAIIETVEFEGNLAAFLNFLRTDPQFYAKTDLDLLGRVALIAKTAEGELPRFFTLLPRATYKIVGDPNRGAYYKPPSGNGTDSGTYFVKIGDLRSVPLYTLESLTLHEGVPGHHLQSALAQELNLPAFRRDLYHSAFGEGWGLYSERLGKEMGFYADPYSDFGRLTYEAWRACRLVVDTGLHAMGWSRQQAVAFMLANTALSVADIESEVDRYITWPAQALSYKIGELKIRELRARAEAELESDFDIRRFHDQVIGHGSLPIAILEELIDEWIAAEKAAH